MLPQLASQPNQALHLRVEFTFIGAIIQKYRPRNGKASKAFQKWIDELKSNLKDTFIPCLEANNMLDIDDFIKKIGVDPSEPILEASDFNGLIAMSQEHQVPVYRLTQEQTQQQGAVWNQTKDSMDVFSEAFNSCADKVLQLTEK